MTSAAAILFLFSGGVHAPATLPCFTNPLAPAGDTPDPWIVFRNGFYYFTYTAGDRIEIAKAGSLGGLAQARKIVVWTAPAMGSDSGDLWAPELHFLGGKWYLYFTATDANNPHRDALRRQFVLEARTDDPQGEYRFLGQLVVPNSDDYMIDGTVCEIKHRLYYLWSGRDSTQNRDQRIYIAPMRDPFTISGPRVMLSAPTYAWERVGWAVNEGPEVLMHRGKIFVTYSASGGTTLKYSLGLLENDSDDLLDPQAWRKSDHPVFVSYQSPNGSVYAPGHNGFFRSPDGRDDWMVYHAKNTPVEGWGGRTARAQRFGWTRHGTPDFGHPLPLSIPIPEPSNRNNRH